MKFNAMRSGLFMVFVLVLLAAPAAYAQTPPKGDDADNPVNVKLNTQKTVDNIQFATTTGTSIEDSSCDPDDSSDNSVWFRFEMPFGGLADVDSGGSIINGSTGSHSFVVLTLYRAGAGLIEVACQLSSGARLVSQNLTAGTYFVRVASDSVVEPTGPSQYRVSVRLRNMSGFLEDPSFENEALGVFWKAKKAGSPPKVTRVCIGGNDCVVRFGGAAGGKIVQKMAIDKNLRYKVGDVVIANAFINNTGVSGANVRLTLKIAYLDGTPATKVAVTRLITQTGTASFTSFGSVLAEIASKKVKNFKFTITSPAASDTFSVESTEMATRAGTSVREPALLPLPLPPAPSGQ